MDLSLEVTALAWYVPKAARQAVPATWHSMWTFKVAVCKALSWIPEDDSPTLQPLKDLACNKIL